MAYPQTILGVPAFYKNGYKGPRNPAFAARAGFPNQSIAANALVAVLGGTNVLAAALYGPGGTLATGPLTLILNVNGAGALTLTFDALGLVNDASPQAMLNAIMAEWPALLASIGGVQGNRLILTARGGGTIVVGGGTANAALGVAGGGGVGNTATGQVCPAILGGHPVLLVSVP